MAVVRDIARSSLYYLRHILRVAFIELAMLISSNGAKDHGIHRKVIIVRYLPYLGDNWVMELVIVAVAILVILLVAKNGSSKRK